MSDCKGLNDMKRRGMAQGTDLSRGSRYTIVIYSPVNQ